MPSAALAVTPLLLYVAQLMSTVVSRNVAVRLGRRRALYLGSMLTILASVAMAFVPSGTWSAAVYAAVPLLGFGLALSMVVSVSIEVRRRGTPRPPLSPRHTHAASPLLRHSPIFTG